MKSRQLRITVLLVLIVVALASSLFGLACTGDWGGLALNFGTEMAGAVATYLLLELVIGRMEKREAEREAEKQEREAKKADLIAQMRSQVQDVAIAAAEELRRRGWLTDGSLRGANLFEANLQGVGLYQADLRGANLGLANLQEADLFMTNLQGTTLSAANLQGAHLAGANLQGAHLAGANLQEAGLLGAYLQGAEFNEDTTLPDGRPWTPDTDMARFTDPMHPDFWSPLLWLPEE